MTDGIAFTKLSGSGNDFICVDNRDGQLSRLLEPAGASAVARAFCNRGMGIGGDGLIIARSPEIEGVADIAAQFLEPDGSESELCGNGTACFVRWALEFGAGAGGEVRILTTAGVVRGRQVQEHYVRVCIPDPQDIRRDVPLGLAGAERCDLVVVGTPHAIVYVPDVGCIDMPHLGPAVRSHPAFGPRGANANFVQVLGQGRLALRTFEFGVEGETLACGTGSAAAAVLTATRLGWPANYLNGTDPVSILSRGGDLLRVWFTAVNDGHIVDVCLETVVRAIYRGTVHPDLESRALGRNGHI